MKSLRWYIGLRIRNISLDFGTVLDQETDADLDSGAVFSKMLLMHVLEIFRTGTGLLMRNIRSDFGTDPRIRFRPTSIFFHFPSSTDKAFRH